MLFDKGYISFSDKGDLIVSTATNIEILREWGINLNTNVGSFNERQKEYLYYHRNYILETREL